MSGIIAESSADGILKENCLIEEQWHIKLIDWFSTVISFEIP